jgi:hypothetical protein
MKDYLASLFRHSFTALAGLGGFLAAHSWIDAGDASSVNAAGVSLGAALSVILTAIAGRLLISLLGKIFAGNIGNGAGSGGGPLLWVGFMAAGLGLALPSCTTTTAPDGSIVTRPDAEGIALGMQLAEWAAYLAWDQEHGDPHGHRGSQVPSAK